MLSLINLVSGFLLTIFRQKYYDGILKTYFSTYILPRALNFLHFPSFTLTRFRQLPIVLSDILLIYGLADSTVSQNLTRLLRTSEFLEQYRTNGYSTDSTDSILTARERHRNIRSKFV